MSNRRITAIILLTCGVLTSWLQIRLDEKTQSDAEPTGPDSYMENFVRTTMDENGMIDTRLNAPFMVHYSNDENTELTRPELELYDANGEPWYVTAEKGWISGANDVVLLRGEVHVWRNGKDGEREIELITREMRVLPKIEYAQTSSPATIINGSTVTKTIGLRANLRDNRVELLSQVRSRHEVKPRNEQP